MRFSLDDRRRTSHLDGDVSRDSRTRIAQVSLQALDVSGEGHGLDALVQNETPVAARSRIEIAAKRGLTRPIERIPVEREGHLARLDQAADVLLPLSWALEVRHLNIVSDL